MMNMKMKTSGKMELKISWRKKRLKPPTLITLCWMKTALGLVVCKISGGTREKKNWASIT